MEHICAYLKDSPYQNYPGMQLADLLNLIQSVQTMFELNVLIEKMGQRAV